MTNQVDVLRTATNTLEEGVISCYGDLIDIALNPMEDKLFLLSAIGNLCVTDLNTRKIINEQRVSANTISTLTITKDGKKLYISGRLNTVSIFDATTFKLIKTIPVDENPGALHISSDGTQLYVSNAGSNTISIIDTVTDNVIRTISVLS